MKDIHQTSPMLIDAFAIPVSLKLSYVHSKNGPREISRMNFE